MDKTTSLQPRLIRGDSLILGEVPQRSLFSGIFVYLTSVVFIISFLHGLWGGPLDLASLLVPSVILCFLSIHGFLKSGRQVINASSIASLGVFFFGGFAGLYTALGMNTARAEDAIFGVLIGIALLFIFQLLLLVATPSSLKYERMENPFGDKPAAAPQRFLVALIALALSIAGVFLGLRSYLGPLGILAIFVLVDLRLQGKRSGNRLTAGVLIFAIVLMFFYYEFIFEGFGRLVLAVMVFGVAILFSFHVKTIALKLAALGAALVALPILSWQRLQFLEEQRGTEPTESEGLGSVVGPLVSFGHLIEAKLAGLFDLAWGATFVDTVTLWFPRAFWPGKPLGFGVDIVKYTQPRLAGNEGFSDAALFGGELIWNFGVIGSFVALPFITWIIYKLNKLIAGLSRVPDTYSSFISRIMIVVSTSGLLHFVWAGSYTYLMRIFVLLFFLFCLKVLAIVTTSQLKSKGRKTVTTTFY